MPGERDLFTGVIQLANLLTRRLSPVFEKAKITPQQWTVLAALAQEDGPATAVGIARTLGVTKQNMTGMMARLEQMGLAERHDDPLDLRSSRVQLTRRGRALVERLRPLYEEWIAGVARGVLSQREVQTLTKNIDRLIDEL